MNTPDDVQGRFLGVPYDWRVPTAERFKQRFWNPEDERLWTPMAFGWGCSMNLYELGRRLRLLD